MAKKAGDVHVSKTDNNRWKVTQNGGKISTHGTQANAINRGRTEAKNDSVDLVTHGRESKIRSKDSFGPDLNPPRDTEHGITPIARTTHILNRRGLRAWFRERAFPF